MISSQIVLTENHYIEDLSDIKEENETGRQREILYKRLKYVGLTDDSYIKVVMLMYLLLGYDLPMNLLTY